MMNQDKSDRLIKFITVKLKRDAVLPEDSDSDEQAVQKNKKGVPNCNVTYPQRLRFEYITEVRLQISNESFSAIQKASFTQKGSNSQQALPVYLRVLNSSSEKDRSGLGSDSENYYIYTNILDQVLAFERSITEMRPTSTDMIKTLS